jgi:hypothetical protein
VGEAAPYIHLVGSVTNFVHSIFKQVGTEKTDENFLGHEKVVQGFYRRQQQSANNTPGFNLADFMGRDLVDVVCDLNPILLSDCHKPTGVVRHPALDEQCFALRIRQPAQEAISFLPQLGLYIFKDVNLLTSGLVSYSIARNSIFF